MLSRWFTAYVGENILIAWDCAVHGKTGLGFNRCHHASGSGLRRQVWRSKNQLCTCWPLKRGLLFDSHSVNDSTAWVMCSCVKACVPVWSLPFWTVPSLIFLPPASICVSTELCLQPHKNITMHCLPLLSNLTSLKAGKPRETQLSDSWVHKQVLFSAVLWSLTVIPYLVCEDDVIGVQMDFCLLMDGRKSEWH